MKPDRPVQLWLASVCTMVILMIAVGGITRLTHSGLSIVEWRPITGVIPPLTDAAWEEMFSKYRQFPEYKLLNHGMELAQFKRIFFWEYLHRLIARLIGFVVLVPWFVFRAMGRMTPGLARRTAWGFALGGLQGLMGWVMVKSGLVHDPRVSHFRLAAHLLLAFLILAWFFWLLLDERRPRAADRVEEPILARWTGWLLGLVVLQITYGAFTAGLRAGFGFNTFPTMNGEWIPSGMLRSGSLLMDLVENPVAVQFLHRSIAWLLVAVFSAFAWTAFRSRHCARGGSLRMDVTIVLAALGVQFLLGVWTLLAVVPVSVATLHQSGAVALFLALLSLRHKLARA